MILDKLGLSAVAVTLVLVTACGGSSDDSAGTAATGGSAGAAGSAAGAAGTAGAAGVGGASGAGGSAAGAGGTAAGAGGGAGAAGAAGTAGAAGMPCDVGTPPPGVATITGTFVQNDVPVPTTTGGDPTGTWVFTKSTTILPAFAKGQVDEKMSSSVGSGWARFEGGKFAIASAFHTVLATAALGMVDQDNVSATKGAFTVDKDVLMLVPECGGQSMFDKPPRFTRAGDTLTLVLHAAAMSGTVDIVVEAAKVSP